MNTAIHNASGTLTVYGLACGYIEKDGPHGPAELEVHLWLEGVYHVRITSPLGYMRRSWMSFDTLTEARRYYDRVARALRSGDAERIDPFTTINP